MATLLSPNGTQALFKKRRTFQKKSLIQAELSFFQKKLFFSSFNDFSIACGLLVPIFRFI